MGWFWTLALLGGVLALFFVGVRLGGGIGRRVPNVGHRDREGKGGRDLGANINPSQAGNEVNLWPDRTGPRTRRELGARHAVDMNFTGDREEHNKEEAPAAPANRRAETGRQEQGAGFRPANDETATGPKQSDPTQPAMQPGVRREVNDGVVEPRQGQPTTLAGDDQKVITRPEGGGGGATADLDPEDSYGEDRPANRTVPPDQPPTQWHPREHGVPGDHIRDGHHRSATAPERKSDATDPYAHAPIPGPNHIPSEDGVGFPRDIQP